MAGMRMIVLTILCIATLPIYTYIIISTLITCRYSIYMPRLKLIEGYAIG